MNADEHRFNKATEKNTGPFIEICVNLCISAAKRGFDQTTRLRGVILPRMTGCRAPVAEGRFPALPRHVSWASTANAMASLASTSTPNSLDAATRVPGRKSAGNVGLWTKADSVTHFDDFQIATDERR